LGATYLPSMSGVRAGVWALAVAAKAVRAAAASRPARKVDARLMEKLPNGAGTLGAVFAERYNITVTSAMAA
jgi:hypothetical protein